MKTLLLLLITVSSMAQSWEADVQIHPYIQGQDGEFLGNLNPDKNDVFSIYNPNGFYGNEYAPMKNPFSLYRMWSENEFAWQLAPQVYWMGDWTGDYYSKSAPWPNGATTKAIETVITGKQVKWWEMNKDDVFDLYLSKKKP